MTCFWTVWGKFGGGVWEVWGEFGDVFAGCFGEFWEGVLEGEKVQKTNIELSKSIENPSFFLGEL